MTFINDWINVAPEFLRGLWVAVRVTAVCLTIGIPAGLLLALGVMSKRRAIHIPVVLLVEAGRGMPALLVLQLTYFGLPQYGLTLSSFVATVAALGLNTAAYTSEFIRGGLQSVPQGEIEAAQAMNMSAIDTLRFIIIPEGLRVAIAPVLGYSILIFQATSLAFTIALPELMSSTISAASSSFQYMSYFIFAGILYLAITIPASQGAILLERRFSRHLPTFAAISHG